MDQREIAGILEEIATLLELKGENPFRVRAYRKGARVLLSIEENLGDLIAEGRLTEYPGIGSHLAEKIAQLFQTGKLPYYETLKKRTPQGLLELIQIRGLGPKKVQILYKKLKIRSLEDLKKSASKGKIGKLKGFGPRTEQNLLKALAHRENDQQRILWYKGWEIAVPILERLKQLKGVKRAEICGSLRRKLETVGDLDFLVASPHSESVIDAFISAGESVLARGETKASIRLPEGIQADLRVVSPPQFIPALTYFTGSKEHTIKIRTRSLKKGWSLSEYGFESKGNKKTPPSLRTEEQLYKVLGLSYIPPELREDLGEIEAAEAGKLPRLIEEGDIRGTFHNHTTASDGRSPLKKMVEAAEALGWEYIGISDHSKSSFQANGLTEERLLSQIETIHQLNRSRAFKIHVFAGSECDILVDGSLDFSDEILTQLDFVIASVHSSFSQSEKTMTRRIIKALEHPLTTMLGHATGRLLLQREGYAVNLSKVIDAAIANQKVIELNGHPRRLDMDWRFWRKAAERGLLCCINSDAHAAEELPFFRFGVQAARKGWLGPKNILNTLPLRNFTGPSHKGKIGKVPI